VILERGQMRLIVHIIEGVTDSAAWARAASPARTPSGDRSWMTPSYS
jgi:hypothetical protein